MESRAKLNTILEDALKVLKTPVEFYRSMPKTGGFADPVIFVLVMAVVLGLAVAVLSLFGAGVIGAMVAGFGAIIMVPIFALVGSFIGAAVLFVVWKLMGSAEPYETAYRCVAYAAAIYPVTAALGLIPYLGTVVGVVWSVYLMMTASVEVHKLNRGTTNIVFGIIGALMLVMNVGSEVATRNMAHQVEKYSESFESKYGNLGEQFENMEDMTPEQAGEVLGGFIKGLNDAAQKSSQAREGANQSGQQLPAEDASASSVDAAGDAPR